MSGNRILVAGHDWGGLNLLAPLLRKWTASGRFAPSFIGVPEVRRQLAQRVPGLTIASASEMLTDPGIGDIASFDLIAERALREARYDLLLCGTSLHAALERRLILAARAAGLRSISFCDMPWALTERFHNGDGWSVPDVLWMTNEPARAQAAAVDWPRPISIEVIGNPLLGEIAQQRRPLAAAGQNFRFISEPVSIEFPGVGLNEFELAATFVSAVRAAGFDAPIIVRPHPIETKGRWNEWIAAHAGDRVALDTLPVTEAIADSRVAVGICSILLAEMAVSGVQAAALQPRDIDPSYFCVPFADYGVAQIADGASLLAWLKSGASRMPMGLGDRDLQAVETATRRVQAILDETRAVSAATHSAN
ncbi:MAG: hypothetical protein PSV22_11720 [Pseudolabrys sp.]|nr:hypothetical protein [Pseudolabrys sp.]